jgi:hypothetical protein
MQTRHHTVISCSRKLRSAHWPSLLGESRPLAPAAATGRLDGQHITGLQRHATLGRQRLSVEAIHARLTSTAATRPWRGDPATFGEQRRSAFTERLIASHHAVTATMHSAASTAGYGTPTYKNSQYKQTDNITASIEVTPKVFSPDNDGIDDMALIRYQLNETGYVANITIFDVNGRMVRHLVKNATLGLNGSWQWDGLDEKGQKLLIGNYIIYTELFNLQGKKKQYKNVVVLARRLN